MRNERSARVAGAQSVDRAVALLSCFLAPTDGLGLGELAKRNELHPSTAHRLLRSLAAGGLVRQDEPGGPYRLAPIAVALGQVALSHTDLGHAPAELASLSDQTGETVTIGILDKGEVVVIMQAEGHQPLRVARPIGTRVPAHASAMGKVLLAFATPNAHVAPLAPLTQRTIIDPAQFRDELEVVRTNGYATNDGEQHDGITAIAVPIRDRTDHAIASLALQAPTVRLTPHRVHELRNLLLHTAHRLGGA